VIMEEKCLSKPLMNKVKRTISRVVDAHTQLEKENWNLERIIDFAGSTLVHEDSITLAVIEGKTAQEIKEYLNEREQEV
ncbi:hypothetical protein, partial [Enterococcus faecium]|uniref:hypothetical protein n=1 Tax=Enterococcus faecium TaxID=1352 RepID=UPI003CC53703